jgi:hypothetical protein
METFRRTLIHEAHWHLEDDVILAPDFQKRALDLVSQYGSSIIRGFATTTIGGVMPGSSYLYNLCTYFPVGYGPAIAEYSRSWKQFSVHPTGFDLVIRDWLVSRHERYWMENPSLVQHARTKSLLGKRSGFRTSVTFTAKYGEVDL